MGDSTKVIVIFLLIIYLPALYSQAPDTLWTKIFGGSGTDVGLSVDETYDGGYIIAGITTSFGSGYDDAYLIKTNEYGDTLWTKTFGGMFGDWVYKVHQTIDSGYVLGGNTYPTGWDGSDFWLIKTDKNGDTLWTKKYGLNDFELCIELALTSDSGYILIGSTGSNTPNHQDLWVVKTDKYGDIEWNKVLGGNLLDAGFEVQELTNGEYILIGSTESYGVGNDDIWLIKLDDAGNTLWTKTYGGPEDEVGVSVRETVNGGFLIAGTTTSFGAGERDIWIIKTDEYGDTLWTKILGGVDGERVEYICSTIDNSYIIVGYSTSFGAGSGDAWLIKINENGETLWQYTFGGIEDDLLAEVEQTSDSGYIAVGHTNTYGQDVWLIKLESDIVAILNNYAGQLDYNLIQNYPNPFNPSTTISYSVPEIEFVTLKVYDVLGSEVITLINEEKPVGSYKIDFNGSELPSGIYFYRLQAGSFVETKKMILMK